MATQVGEASVALKFDTKGAAARLKAETQSTLASTEKAFSSWTVTIGDIAAKAFEKVATFAKEGIEGGIRRFDTINRFPKVLKSIGFSAEDAAKAIKDIEQYVQGLPTAMDDAANAVQRIAQKTGDLNGAVITYKAMNNAMLSGGANIERQQQAMEQWIQAVNRGRFEGVEWKDLQETMPGVLNTAAKEMLGQKASAENLRDALSSGKISMEDFLDEIEKLNTEGADAFEPLEKQARTASEGVSTSLTTIKQQVEVVWKKVLDAIGSENIQKILGNIRQKVIEFGDLLVKLIEWVKENWPAIKAVLQGIWEWISTRIVPVVVGFVGWVIETWPKIIAALQAVATWIQDNIFPIIQALIAWVQENVVPTVQRIFEMVGPIIQKIITFIGDVWTTVCTVVNALMPVIQPVVAGIIGFVGGAVMLIIGLIEMIVNFISGALDVAIWTWENIISPIVEFVSGVISAIIGSVVWLYTTIQNIVGAIAAFWGATFNAIKDFVGSAINAIVSFVTGIPGRISSAVNDVKNFFIDAFNAVKDFIKGVVDSIVEFIMSIPSRIAGIGGEIANSIMSGIGDLGGQIGGAISSGVSSAVSGLGGAVQGALSAIGLASGGYVKATPGGTLAVIGEGGEDEFVIPRSKMIDILSGVATSPLPELKADNMRVDGGGIVVYNTYEINNELDADDIGRRINNSIRLATI